jgi:hypothetical protein
MLGMKRMVNVQKMEGIKGRKRGKNRGTKRTVEMER